MNAVFLALRQRFPTRVDTPFFDQFARYVIFLPRYESVDCGLWKGLADMLVRHWQSPAIVQTDVLMTNSVCEMIVVLLSRCDMLFQENFGACSAGLHSERSAAAALQVEATVNPLHFHRDVMLFSLQTRFYSRAHPFQRTFVNMYCGTLSQAGRLIRINYRCQIRARLESFNHPSMR
jgi:hypothetical protein